MRGQYERVAGSLWGLKRSIRSQNCFSHANTTKTTYNKAAQKDPNVCKPFKKGRNKQDEAWIWRLSSHVTRLSHSLSYGTSSQNGDILR